MPKFTLVSAEEVLTAMGQDPELLEAATPAVESALQRAVIKLESLLEGEVGLQTVTDTFFLDESEGLLPDGMWRLRLSNGVLRPSTEPSITLSDRVGGTPSNAADSWVNYEKGFAFVPEASARAGQYVTVSYKSGYSVDDDPDTIPEELKQFILLSCPLLLLSATQSTAEPKQQAADLNKANSLNEMSLDMLPTFRRNIGAALKPIRTARQRIRG